MLSWSFYSAGKRKASSFYGVNLDAWFQMKNEAEDMEQLFPDRPPVIKQRWRVPLPLFLIFALFGAFALFVWRTLPGQPQIECRAAIVNVYFPQDGSVLFNLTTIAPPVISSFHEISMVSAKCTVWLMQNQVTVSEDFAHINVQGPISLLQRTSSERHKAQSLHGAVHFADLIGQEFASVFAKNASFGIACSALTSIRLYWSIYKMQRIEVFNSTLSYGFEHVLNETFQNVRLTGLLEDLRNDFRLLDQQQALAVLVRLPLIRDSSGLIKALYVHLPEVSFDFSLGFLGDLSVRNPKAAIDAREALFTFGSYPGRWLMMAGNEAIVAPDQANFFISCVRGDCSKSIRAVFEAFFGAFTTHPLQGVAILATASATSSPLVTKLLGKQHLVVFSQQQHRRRRLGALADYSDCIRAEMFENWRLEICGNSGAISWDMTTGQSSFGMNQHPSAIIVLANRDYFDNDQGNPLLLVHLNVTELRKFTVGDSRSLLGFDVAQGQNDSAVQDNTLMSVCSIQVEENNDKVFESYLEVDFGFLQEQAGTIIDTSFFAVKVSDAGGNLVWKMLNSANRTILQPLDFTVYQNRMNIRVSDAVVLDWNTIVEEKVLKSHGWNYYMPGYIYRDSYSSTIKLKLTTNLQLGSDPEDSFGAESNMVFASTSENFRSCYQIKCSEFHFSSNCNSLNFTSNFDVFMSLDGWWKSQNLSADLQVSHNSIGDEWHGSNRISVSTSNKGFFDWSNDYHHDCVTDLKLDDRLDMQYYYPFLKEIHCSLRNEYRTSFPSGIRGDNRFGASGQHLLNYSKNVHGNCHSFCYEMISKESALNTSLASCSEYSSKVSDFQWILLMDGARNNLESISLQWMLSGASFDHSLTGSSLFSMSENNSPLITMENEFLGRREYVEDVWFAQLLPNSTATDYTSRDVYNLSLQCCFSTRLEIGSGENAQSMGSTGNLSFTSLKTATSKCTATSCNHFSSSDIELDLNVSGRLNESSIALDEVFAINAIDELWYGKSTMKTTRNGHPMLNWTLSWEGTHLQSHEQESTYKMYVFNYTSADLNELLVSCNYSTSIELAVDENRGSLVGRGQAALAFSGFKEFFYEFAAIALSMYPNGSMYNYGPVVYFLSDEFFKNNYTLTVSMDGLWNNRDRICFDVSSTSLHASDLLKTSNLVSATNNSQPLLSWNSSMVAGSVQVPNRLTLQLTNMVMVGAEGWIDFVLEGLIAPIEASLAISNAGRTTLLVSGKVQDQWFPAQSRLVATAESAIYIPDASVELNWTNTLQAVVGLDGMYVVSLQVVDNAPTQGELAHASSPVLNIDTSLTVQGAASTSFEDFLRQFTTAATGLAVNLNVWVRGSPRLSLSSFLSSTGDMQGDTQQVSCLQLDLGFNGWETLMAFGDLRMTGLELRSLGPNKSFIALQHVMVELRHNNDTMEVQKTNEVYLGTTPSCDVVTTARLHMIVDVNCVKGYCRGDQGYCAPCYYEVTTSASSTFTPPPSPSPSPSPSPPSPSPSPPSPPSPPHAPPVSSREMTPPLVRHDATTFAPTTTPPPPTTTPPPPTTTPPPIAPPPAPKKANETLARAASTVTTVITTTTAIAASSVAVSSVATAVVPSISSSGAATTGASGRSGSFATSLILQTQFIAITGQIGGNSSTDAVSAFSSQLSWSNYKFFSIFEGDTNTTCDRAKQSSNELFATLIACSGTLALAALLRVSSNLLAKSCRSKERAAQEVASIPFPKWELALSLTQVQGLALATSAAIASGCSLYMVVGAIFLTVLLLEIFSMCLLAMQAKRGKLLWQSKVFHDAWVEMKHDISELKTVATVSSVATVSQAISTPFVRGSWNVDEEPAKRLKSEWFMSRFGILVEEVCLHAWWFGVYAISSKIVHALVVNFARNETVRSLAMTACTVLDLVLLFVFTPQIDWRSWITQLLAALGNFGICFTFFLRNLDQITEARVNTLYFAFVIISVTPMILASLGKDVLKGSGAIYEFIAIFNAEEKEKGSKNESNALQRRSAQGEMMKCVQVECQEASNDCSGPIDMQSGPYKDRSGSIEILEEPCGQNIIQTSQSRKAEPTEEG